MDRKTFRWSKSGERETGGAEIEVFSDQERLIHEAAERLVRLASKATEENRMFSIVLSGGSTPRPLYLLLAREPFIRRIDWSRVHVFWGDERCVAPTDPRSNYRMAREALLDTLPLTADQIHRIRGEGDPPLEAVRYEQELQSFFKVRAADGRPREGFDLVLLGMGENGHTASLFPGSPAVAEQVRWVMAQYVETDSMWRVTLTPVVINAAKNVIFLVSGGEKAERLQEVLEGPFQPEVLPAQIVQPVRGRLSWFVDAAAGGHLKRSR